MRLTFFAEEEKNPPSYLLFLAPDRADLPVHFPILTQFKEDLYTDILILAMDVTVSSLIHPKPGSYRLDVAIFVPSSAGFA